MIAGLPFQLPDASPDLLSGPDLWSPNFADWLTDFDGSNGVKEGTLVTPQSVADSYDHLVGPTVVPGKSWSGIDATAERQVLTMFLDLSGLIVMPDDMRLSSPEV